VEERISSVKDFLSDVKPSMVYSVVPITDGFGPTVVDPDMDLIVLSQETKKGGEMINEERQKKVEIDKLIKCYFKHSLKSLHNYYYYQ
jgi:phosphopantetheine adenylyltransferase/dephospho-CoA kinase